MKQARYTVENTGHFGLAADCYCHFTSPIRRYPDLQIHRIIKDSLRGRLGEKRIGHYTQILPEVAKHASEMERRADEAERETIKLKKCSIWKPYRRNLCRCYFRSRRVRIFRGAGKYCGGSGTCDFPHR